MKLTCRYSGVEFEVFGTFKYVRAIDAHPVMHLPLAELLPIYTAWTDGKLSEVETRLLFVALLKQTELFIFHIPAIPEVHTIALNMEKLCSFVNSKDIVIYTRRTFPHINIDRNTYRLKNMRELLERFDECKENWFSKGKHDALRVKLETREAQLAKLINSPNGDQNRKLDVLAKWTMDAAEVPKEKRELWTRLFKLSGLDLLQPEFKDDFEELVDHLELHFLKAWSYGTGWFGKVALDHIRNLAIRNGSGLYGGLGMEDFLSEGQGQAAGPTWKFIDNIEDHNIAVAAATAPSAAPKREDYPSTVKYCLALSAWRCKEALGEVEKSKAAVEKQQDVAETLASIDAKEEAVLPPEEDPLQDYIDIAQRKLVRRGQND